MTYPVDGQPPDDRPQYPQQPTSYPETEPGFLPPDQPQQEYPPQSPKRSGTSLIVGLVVLVALVVIGATIASVLLTAQGRGPLVPDEQKVELAIRDFYDTLGSYGFRAALEQACEQERAAFESMTDAEKREFDIASVSITIDRIENIDITGDLATADVTGRLSVAVPGAQPQTQTSTTERLHKEDGRWRICSSGGGR
ncbi:hypothetical protein ACL02S_20715 [Nocardia sp. 004]|uniref:Rv0361 family membrane protein n=1 Tax=Nocardia sp. 004 TaxID=3385978 RepID=UPI00399F33F5